MTKVISFVNSKGGAGKSTLAFALAVYWNKIGKHVLLIDTDPQASLMTVFGVREDKGNMEGMAVDVGKLESRVKAEIASDAHDIIIVDSPGKMENVKPVVKVADVVAIPVQPSGLDLFAFKRAYDVCAKEKRQALVVPNRIKTTRDEQDVVPPIIAMTGKADVVGPMIGDRVNHRMTSLEGLTLADIESGSGKLEVKQLAEALEEKANGA